MRSTVKSTVENLGPTRVRLAIELGFDELKPSLDAAYKKIGGQIRVPGFRPGRAPARIIDQRVGRGAVLEEAVNAVLPRAYQEAIIENGVKALGTPEIEVTKLDDGDSLAFTAEVDVRPEFTLPDLSTLEVTVDSVEVTDDDVETQLESLRRQFATLKAVERPVAATDFVSLDLKAVVDGVEVEGGSAKGLSYEVGSDELIPGLDDAIIGTSAGDSAEFPTTLAQGEFAGSESQISVTVNSVKVRELPTVDDEFAQLASEFDTVEELRADIRERVSRVKGMEQGAQARDRVLEALLAQVDLPLPASLVQAETDARQHDIVHSLGHDDAAFDEFLAGQAQTREEFTTELRESAEKTVRAQFILDAIADREQVSIENAELTEYIVRQAQRYNLAPKEFADEIVKAGNLPALMADVRRNKALATVMQTAIIADAAGNRVDLGALSPAQLADDGPDFEDDTDSFEDDTDSFEDDADGDTEE